ncbi:hypothetical protein [Ruegeria sp. HKCCD8929]|uniref:hypothetical protein n=1 Tax=Ruegeria sp. HKCCD8929 TaxID=2683006 RepID=UPI001C2C3759|nr:hypothetical protein [Ruegeria sp. HKCCD8929]
MELKSHEKEGFEALTALMASGPEAILNNDNSPPCELLRSHPILARHWPDLELLAHELNAGG